MDDDLDRIFEDLPSASEALGQQQQQQPAADNLNLGHTLQSSRQGIVVKLDTKVEPEDIPLGSYAIVCGKRADYLTMVDDVAVVVDQDAINRRKPNEIDMTRLLNKGTAYAQLHLSAHLKLEHGDTKWQPARTVPTFLCPVRKASQAEIGGVFGAEGKGFLSVGQPIDMPGVDIALSLAKMAERSVGIFGGTGTGKSFLARMLLAGMIKDRMAVNLIFDMHNEYGWEGSSEGVTKKVKGLKQIFPDGRISIFTLDHESSRRRGSNPDYVVNIPYSAIEPEDMESLQVLLDLSEAQVGAIYALARRLGRGDKNWLYNFLDDDWVDQQESLDPDTGKMRNGLQVIAADTGQLFQTLAALRRKLDKFRRYGFLVRDAREDSVGRILRYLETNTSVVLEFGRYGNDLDAYIFVANYLTRRIHDKYVEKKETAFGGGGQEPTPLVITIEEAHKFLDPAIAKHTIFGTIAREMRKYNVTLCVVDQRPSQIDPEVMSQIGTRITASLTNPNDIAAVFNGVMGADEMRDVLARLDTRQQAMILGHAVPMPAVIQTRAYDLAFYSSMGWQSDEELRAGLQARTTKMRGEERDGFD